MKRVLIAGAGSYIGERLAAWLAAAPEAFETHTLSLRGDGWKAFDFSGFNTVVLVAGVAHQKETPENAPLYDAVNRALAVDVASAAKRAGVGQFVFFSSMSVYGLTTGRVTADTRPAPNTAYGRSKLAAETELNAMADDRFHVAVLRPPMIYGRGCRGNYPRLSALIQRTPVFPRIRNERSMLYVNTLCAFLAALITSGEGGLYFPQNRDYVDTGALAAQIALAHGKRLWQPRGAGWLFTLLSKRSGAFGKVFGTLTYDQAMSAAFRPAEEPGFAETVRATEAEG
jgi:nucleoside-diphosphate-sugar epimerase